MPSIYTLEGFGLAESDLKPASGCKCFIRTSKKGKRTAFHLCRVPKGPKGSKGSKKTGWEIKGECPKKEDFDGR